MSRPNSIFLMAFLVAIIAVLGGITVAKGGFYIAKHEVDTLHVTQIVFRMAEGEWPHLDFLTPIGALAFWPITAFLNLGMGIGAAMIWGQIAVALVLLLPTFWVARTRFDSPLAYLFGFAVLVLILALVHGEADRSVSISMHYNRWAWAISYLVIITSLFPNVVRENAKVDGALIGLGMAALAMIKVTYFIAFAPALLLILIARKAFPSLAIAAATGIVCVLIITVFSGLNFWTAYIGDLKQVSSSGVRPNPGQSLQVILGSPAYLGGSIALMAGVVFLRQAKLSNLGLGLLLLAPGFLYVTYQNFGNDPQWMLLFAIILLMPKVDAEVKNGWGIGLASALKMTAMAALAFAAPSFLNLSYSPFRHATIDPSEYVPILSASEVHNDLYGRVVRTNRVDGTVGLDGEGSGLESRQELAKRDVSFTVFQGETLPDCELKVGLVAWAETIVSDLEANGYGDGSKMFIADMFSGHWLFGDIQRLKNGAPWFYGGLPGIEDADYLLVPQCPILLEQRKNILEAIVETGAEVKEVHRSALYVLFEFI